MGKTSNASKRPKRAKGTHQVSSQPEAPSKRERKERLSKGAKIVLVVIGCLAMLLSVTSMACSGVLNQVKGSDTGYHLTGGVAATVNDVKITEDTVTKDIMQQKASYSDDAAWAQYLVDNGYTPESLREQVIDGYIEQALVSQAKRENNIAATDEELEAKWQEQASQYGGEDALMNMVQMLGYDKATYLQAMVAPQIENEKLAEAVAPVEVTDDEVLAYINEHLDEYGTGRRSSHILFKVADDGSDDEEQKAAAQEVLDKINAGELSFEDAAKEYSDDGSGADGGDVGWDCLTQFVTEYQDGLDNLDKGEVSGLVRSTYGYHIIKCTDLYQIDGQATSLDQVPQEVRDYVRNILETQEREQGYSTWFEDYKASASIQVNPMPEDVPYNVSLEGVTPGAGEDTSAGTETEAGDGEAAE